MKRGSGILLSVLMATGIASAGKNVIIADDPVAPVVGNFYIGAGVSLVNFEFSESIYDMVGGSGGNVDETTEYEWKSGMALAGYKFNEYISIEGRYTKSIGDATLTEGANLTSLRSMDDITRMGDELENIAIYLKPSVQFDAFSLYGLLGYGKTTITWEDGKENSDSSFQYGAGASYAFTENLSVFADYVVMYDDDDFDNLVEAAEAAKDPDIGCFKSDAITVGMIYTF